MLEKEVKISNIEISIGKKTLNLTKEEAKKLHEVLEDMFQKKVIVERYHDWWYHNGYPYVITCSDANVSNMTTGHPWNTTTGNTVYTITGTTDSIKCFVQ